MFFLLHSTNILTKNDSLFVDGMIIVKIKAWWSCVLRQEGSKFTTQVGAWENEYMNNRITIYSQTRTEVALCKELWGPWRLTGDPVLVLSDKKVCKVLHSSTCLSNCVSQCQDNSAAKVVIGSRLHADQVIGDVLSRKKTKQREPWGEICAIKSERPHAFWQDTPAFSYCKRLKGKLMTSCVFDM